MVDHIFLFLVGYLDHLDDKLHILLPDKSKLKQYDIEQKYLQKKILNLTFFSQACSTECKKKEIVRKQ